jgi:hypothetical protein
MRTARGPASPGCKPSRALRECGLEAFAEKRWAGRSTGEFNSGTTFVAGPHTWHGFDPRPIMGQFIDHVRADWRDREQVADPEHPIHLG